MENKIITKTDKQFGTVRCINENGTVLFCATDIAKALGYKDAINATKAHCRGVVKRHPTISRGRVREINFIPECDVYRLICHSKLPAAARFEKWVFEDIVPKAVRGEDKAAPQQLTLEIAEYHYFDKTFRGDPVITLTDFEFFTGIHHDTARTFVKKYCSAPNDYEFLVGELLADFKNENTQIYKTCNSMYILHRSAVKKLLNYYRCSSDIPMLSIADRKLIGKQNTASCEDCVTALGVLGVVRDRLINAENREAACAVDIAIKHTAWELSRRITT